MPISIDFSKVEFDVWKKRLEESQKKWGEAIHNWMTKTSEIDLPVIKLEWNLPNGKEIDVTQSEKDRIEKMVTLLEQFREDAGVLHQTQYNRLDAVLTFLKEKASEEEGEKMYHIFWEEANLYFIGMVTENDHPLWVRDKTEATQYAIGKGSECLRKLKNVEGMTLRLRPIDGEEPTPEVQTPVTAACATGGTAGNTSQQVKKVPVDDGTRRPFLAIRQEARPVYWSRSIRDQWTHELANAVRYYNFDEAEIAATNILKTAGVKCDIVRVAWTHGDNFAITSGVEEAKPVCGLKEIPKDERKYRVRLNHEKWIYDDVNWTWTSKGIVDQYPPKEYLTREEAERKLASIKNGYHLQDYRETACVEVVA